MGTRRLTGDLIEVIKICNGYDNVSEETFYSLLPRCSTIDFSSLGSRNSQCCSVVHKYAMHIWRLI